MVKFNGSRAFYDKPKQLLEDMLPHLRKYDPTVEASFHDMTKTFYFKGLGQYRIHTFSPLCYMLGLRREEW